MDNLQDKNIYKYSVCRNNMVKKSGENKKEKNAKACSKCGSGQTYVRIKEGSRVCRSCGHIDPIED